MASSRTRTSPLSAPTVQRGQLLRPYPQFLNVTANLEGVGHSTYHALQLSLERRYTSGLAVIFNYTHSKSIDNVGEAFIAVGAQNGFQNNNCFSCDRAISVQNVPDSVRLSFNYELPFGPGKKMLTRGFASRFVGGWSAGSFLTLNTGFPLAVTSPNTSGSFGGGNANRPIATGVSDSLPNGPTFTDGGLYFNPAAFARTPAYAFGNVSRYLPDITLPRRLQLGRPSHQTNRYHGAHRPRLPLRVLQHLQPRPILGPQYRHHVGLLRENLPVASQHAQKHSIQSASKLLDYRRKSASLGCKVSAFLSDNRTQVNSMRPTTAEPCVLVIFGAGGDLTKRLLAPSLYNLKKENRLPDDFAVIGFARTDVGGEEGFRKKISDDLNEFVGKDADQEIIKWIASRLSYVRSAFDNAPGYQELKQKLEGKAGNYLYYLATAPEFFAEVPKQLKAAGLTDQPDHAWRRLIVEKPFGHDLPTSRNLNKQLSEFLCEDQIYRIDHYLGKETVQNIMVLRFGNGIFEPVWNRRYIDHVQITVAETVGVETRGGYYETAGALRDMVPNHILQLVALAAMEPPNSFQADAVREEQVKALHAIAPSQARRGMLTNVVRGQYGPGTIGDKQIPAYRDEQRVAKDSPCRNLRRHEARHGQLALGRRPLLSPHRKKSMAQRTTEMTIQFRKAPFHLFRETPVEELGQNKLVLQLQPNEGISLEFEAKVPGPEIEMKPVSMNFVYADFFGKSSKTGYETLLFDCMIGDPTLFKTAAAVDAGWEIVQPVLDLWSHEKPVNFPNYTAGSWGPQGASDLLERDGRRWTK